MTISCRVQFWFFSSPKLSFRPISFSTQTATQLLFQRIPFMQQNTKLNHLVSPLNYGDIAAAKIRNSKLPLQDRWPVRSLTWRLIQRDSLSIRLPVCQTAGSAALVPRLIIRYSLLFLQEPRASDAVDETFYPCVSKRLGEGVLFIKGVQGIWAVLSNTRSSRYGASPAPCVM